jgi:hypothetical protein
LKLFTYINRKKNASVGKVMKYGLWNKLRKSSKQTRYLIYVRPGELHVRLAPVVAGASVGKGTLNLLAKNKLQTLSVISGLSIFPWRFQLS